jgi:hypothetical protein
MFLSGIQIYGKQIMLIELLDSRLKRAGMTRNNNSNTDRKEHGHFEFIRVPFYPC